MKRIVPLVLAVALFMENMDSTVIATSLATIARDIGTSPIALKLALTSYYVSLAVFIPISGRMADRFGAKTVFRWAIGVFVVGSLACAIANSLEGFVAARFLQGVGGAMMTPVGRLLLVRAVPRSDLVSAMAWFTIPALVGPLVGPPIGGAIATYADWRWIFLINLPIGLVGIALATRFLPFVEPVPDISFDWRGFALSGFACAGIVFGLSVVSLPALPPVFGGIMVIAGAIAAAFYVRHARQTTRPVLELRLLKIQTLRAAIIGGAIFRIGAGAVPFLFPLMLQLGFGYTPLQSGLVSAASIGGAMMMKFLAKPVLKRFGFRSTLIGAGVIGGGLMTLIGFYEPTTPLLLLISLLLIGGFFRSLFFTSVNVLAFADVPEARTGDATAMLAAFQQVAIATGVATAGAILEIQMAFGTDGVSTIADFQRAFIIVGAVTVFAAIAFVNLSSEAGAEIAGRRVPAE
ncbi:MULTISPECIES: MFS transporter [unclassified Aureimonas]|uniref:MFS transporter n=1 Tax=unclassified Aureimonas TaxID=2615206 RepID=UPI0006FF2AFE|nr:MULTISPECIES: MFS transporter [unclassified Aureimonas]KQT53803.1 MFS transporter [Aureimonas sp. Leaf427]KQT71756.1 MFS transporter [Aureimonas sp. Leaf460]